MDLSDQARETVNTIKTTLEDYIATTENVAAKRRVLSWNDGMDELYLSAPKHATGSDKVFITPHIDGFVGWIPFMRAYRCVYGLTGPHDTVTIQPMRNPDEKEVTLGPGVFTCFDFNREIHWIENRRDANATSTGAKTADAIEERMVLKLHFYEYPAVLSLIAPYFGAINRNYNFAARAAFLASQFPDRSVFAKLIGSFINGITVLGGSAEVVYGLCNLCIVSAITVATKANLQTILLWLGSAHLVLYVLAFVFRQTTQGMLVRDAVALKATSGLVLAVAYGRASWKRFSPLSFLVALAGFTLSAWAFQVLGRDLTYFGRELGVVPADRVIEHWPLYGPGALLPHPMILGSVVGMLGLRLHPTFGPEFARTFWVQCVLYAVVLALEVTNLHLPSKFGYFAVFESFEEYHRVEGNVFAHLVTTGIGVLGLLGIVQNNCWNDSPVPPPLSSDEAKGSAKQPDRGSHLPLMTLGGTWLVSRYTVPDDDTAYAVVALMAASAQYVWMVKPNNWTCLLLLALSVGLQELAHYYFGEGTYMASYADGSVPFGEAMLTFGLHNIWLLPFEIRAAINTMTQVLTPSMAPGTL